MHTITAVATPPGIGGISIVRISGKNAKELLARTFLPHSPNFANFIPWRLHHGAILDKKGEILDDVLAVFMPAPNSYTGEDVAEIHCHGNPVITGALLEHLYVLGAQPAGPGEFTKRAFLNGKIDLSQAEAVAEIIAAPTRNSVKLGFDKLDGSLSREIFKLIDLIDTARQLFVVALDVPEDEIDLDQAQIKRILAQILAKTENLLKNAKIFDLSQHGAKIVIAGKTNAGKSSLLNALSGKNRVLVSPYAGTTRDFVEQPLILDNLSLTLVDTAGLRETDEPVEKMGIAKSLQQAKEADLVLLVIDGDEWINNPKWQEEPFTANLFKELKGEPVIVVLNKKDLNSEPDYIYPDLPMPVCQTSCLTGENIEQLRGLITKTLLGTTSYAQDPAMPNARQAALLELAKKELEILVSGLDNMLPLDCAAVHLDNISQYLGEMLGLSSSEEIIDKIFANFCIGK